MRRTLAISYWAVAMTVAARPGTAQPAKGQSPQDPEAQQRRESELECQSAYKKAQKLEQQGELVTAKRLLRSCAEPKCGVFLEHQCTSQHARIESDMPSVVPTATDESGKPVVDVTLKVDGYALASRLDGHAVRISPGLHEFSFESKDGAVAKRRIMILQGQRNRLLAVSLGRPGPEPEREQEPERAPDQQQNQAEAERPPASPPSAPERDNQAEPSPAPDMALTAAPAPPKKAESRWFSPASYALLGTGVAGVVGYGLLTYWGRKDNEDLSQCSPNCPQSSVDHIDNIYRAANISLGVGVAALLGGSYLVWRQHARYRLEVEPTRSGGLATFSGVF